MMSLQVAVEKESDIIIITLPLLVSESQVDTVIISTWQFQRNPQSQVMMRMPIKNYIRAIV
jgi:hypothetical protein